MRSDRSDDNAGHPFTGPTHTGPLRLRTMMAWHRADDQQVRQAFAAALDALDERANGSRFILDDPHVYGLTDPDELRHQLDADDAAALVIRSVLDNGTEQDPR
jgi:hypothetical protein